MKRLLPLLLALSALLVLGGCAVEPAYRYNANDGGGYYYGQSAYGNADTVIYGSGYVSPWGWGGWGPGWGWWGPGWWGYGGIGFGATYIYHPHHRHYWHPRRHWHHHGHHAWHGSHHHHWRHGHGHHHHDHR